MKRQLLTTLLGIPADVVAKLSEKEGPDTFDLAEVARWLIKNERLDLLYWFRSQPALDGTCLIGAAATRLGIHHSEMAGWGQHDDDPMIFVPSPQGLTLFEDMLLLWLYGNGKKDLAKKWNAPAPKPADLEAKE